MAPGFRDRRGERARCGISVGGFLCQPKRTQAICFVGASLYLVLGGRPHFYVYKFCHLEWVLGAAATVRRAMVVVAGDAVAAGRMRGSANSAVRLDLGENPAKV